MVIYTSVIITWEEALKLNLALGNDGTPTLRQFLDFKELLERGIDQEEKVFYANGKEIKNSKILKAVYDEIFKTRNHFRGEFLDAYFEEINDILHLNQDHKIVNGLLVSKYSQPVLEDSLMENCYVDLKRCNEQGLPTGGKGGIFYWPPKNGNVAWFYAYSDGAVLYCNGDLDGSNASLGVRAKKIHEFKEI